MGSAVAGFVPQSGVAKEAAIQHLAVALDGQLVTTPSIDFTAYPEGIDAANRSEISGGVTTTAARELADEYRRATAPFGPRVSQDRELGDVRARRDATRGFVAA
jgi:hypothetical protein